MKGSDEVVRRLNELLGYELASMDTYLAQATLLENWGYLALHARIRHESEDERAHAEALMKRIVFLEGTPQLAPRPTLVLGADPHEMLVNDLAYEHQVARMLNELMAFSEKELDHGTRKLLDHLLEETENDHIHWLESQLTLIAQLGVKAYLAEQLTAPAK